jgi:hypothetical protein
MAIFFLSTLLRVLKWGLLFNELGGLTVTCHSPSTGGDSSGHSLAGPHLHARAHHSYSLSTDRIANTASSSFSIVACLLVAAGTCSPHCCLAMAAFICSIIPTFSRRVTVCKVEPMSCHHLSHLLQVHVLSLTRFQITL